jgi:hypothetical protein
MTTICAKEPTDIACPLFESHVKADIISAIE